MRSLSYALIQALRADVDSILQALRVPAHDPAFSDRHGAEDSTFVFYSLGYVDRSVERFHLTTREASALPKHLAAGASAVQIFRRDGTLYFHLGKGAFSQLLFVLLVTLLARYHLRKGSYAELGGPRHRD